MAELRDIQLCELEILNEIKRICDKHNIDYYLAYGTLLGAVRHQGFIPWDDDLDIQIVMKNFKKLVRHLKKDLSKDYFFEYSRLNPYAGRLFYKFRKNGTEMLEPNESHDSPYHHGIWVDVFPLFPFSDNKAVQNMQISLIRNVPALRSHRMRILKKENTIKSAAKKFYNTVIRLIEQFMWLFAYILGIKGNSYITINYLFTKDVPFDYCKTYVYKRSWFKTPDNYMFENQEFKSVHEFDKMLTISYGKDYMTPKKTHVHSEKYDDVIL